MISFDKKQNVVKLNNGSISYWIYINSEGYLETVYFGKKIKDFDISHIRVTDGAEKQYFQYYREQGNYLSRPLQRGNSSRRVVRSRAQR